MSGDGASPDGDAPGWFRVARRAAAVVLPLGYAAVALGLAVRSRETARALFESHAYVLTAALLATWAWTLRGALPWRQLEWRALARRHGAAALACAALTAAVFATVPVANKVLWDELDLSSTARAFAERHVPSYWSEQVQLGGRMQPVRVDTPWRPVLFPFLVHGVHLLRGIHDSNPFVVNALALMTLYVLVYAIFQRLLDRVSALGAVPLVAASPVLSLTATSGIFDLVSLVVEVAFAICLWRYLTRPDAQRLRLLWIHGLLFGSVRYESGILVAIVAAGLLAARRVGWRELRDHALLAAWTPVLMLPVVLQRLAVGLADSSAPGGRALSLGYFRENLVDLGALFVPVGRTAPYPVWVDLVGLAVMLALLMPSERERWSGSRDVKAFVSIGAVALAVSVLIFLLHFMGNAWTGTSARFYLAPVLVLALMLPALRLVRPDLVGARALVAAGACAFLVHHSIAMHGSTLTTVMFPKRLAASRQYVAGKDPSQTLTVSAWPIEFSSSGFGAVGFDYADAHLGELADGLRNGEISEILVFQMYARDAEAPVDGHALALPAGAPLALEPVDTVSLSTNLDLRVSRLALASPDRAASHARGAAIG